MPGSGYTIASASHWVSRCGNTCGRVATALRRSVWAIAIVVSAGFIVAVHLRVLTYVCGNDPMLYIRAGRVVLQPELYGRGALTQALTFVAPGYPLLLAATIRVFGSLAPYWLNLALLLASLPLMWFVLRRLMGSDRAALFAMIWAWVILLGGHELNAAFLFHPFREAPVLLCAYAAYALLLRATQASGRGFWAAAAALVLIAACTFREPSVFLAGGGLLGLLGLVPTWRARLRLGAWFVLPWVLLAVAAWVALQALGYAGSSQFEAIRYLRNTGVAVARMRQMLGWIPAEAGWVGTGCMVVGMARAARRSPALLAWFLVPSVLLFVFYAHMQMHARYFLAAFLYAVVFAGYGLDGLLRLFERRVAAWPRALPVVTTGACTVALVALMVGVVGHAHPWGPLVTAREVREWQALVSKLEPSADGRVRIAVEQRCRYLEDMLLSYTDAELLNPKQVGEWTAPWAPAHYFQPLNRAAKYATPQWLMWLKIYAHRILSDRMDLLPVGADLPVIHTIGQGEYEQYRLQPWTAGRHQQDLALEPGRDQVLWLDWGACPTAIVRTVTIQEAQTGTTLFSQSMTGNGLQAIFLSAQVCTAAHGLLTVESSSPAPAQPVIRVASPTVPQYFDFGPDRRISVNRLLSVLDDNYIEVYPFALRVGCWQELRGPVMHGNAGGTWRIRFIGRKKVLDPLCLRCRRQDGTETVQSVTATNQQCFIEMGSGETVSFVVEFPQIPARHEWPVAGLSLEYRPADTHGE